MEAQGTTMAPQPEYRVALKCHITEMLRPISGLVLT